MKLIKKSSRCEHMKIIYIIWIRHDDSTIDIMVLTYDSLFICAQSDNHPDRKVLQRSHGVRYVPVRSLSVRCDHDSRLLTVLT